MECEELFSFWIAGSRTAYLLFIHPWPDCPDSGTSTAPLCRLDCEELSCFIWLCWFACGGCWPEDGRGEVGGGAGRGREVGCSLSGRLPVSQSFPPSPSFLLLLDDHPSASRLPYWVSYSINEDIRSRVLYVSAHVCQTLSHLL
jgi:hypothetical protein